MKILALACVLGLNALFIGYNNTSILIAQKSCFHEGRSYPHGSEITIGRSTYRCNNSRWVIIS